MGYIYEYDRAYIYELRYANNRPFYVGKTVSPYARKHAHQTQVANNDLADILRKLRDENRDYRFVIVKEVPFKTSQWHETNQMFKRIKQGYKIVNKLFYDKKENKTYRSDYEWLRKVL